MLTSKGGLLGFIVFLPFGMVGFFSFAAFCILVLLSSTAGLFSGDILVGKMPLSAAP